MAFCTGSVDKVSVTGGAPVLVSSEPARRGGTWATDDSIVFTVAGAGLSRVSAEGGVVETLTTPDFESREKTHRAPHALPDGKAVLFTRGSADIDSFDDASIAVLELETGEQRILVEGGMSPHITFSSGHVVYARAGAVLAVPFDLDVARGDRTSGDSARRRLDGPHCRERRHRRVVHGAIFCTHPEAHSIRLAPFSGWREPARRRRSSRPGGRFENVRVSPDGQRMVIWVGGANNSLWIYDIARQTMTRLVSGFENILPVWAPSGDRIAFTSDRAGADNLYAQLVDGSAPPERLTTTTNQVFHSPTAWSPDGQWLAFSERRPEAGANLWLLPMEGGGAPQPFAQSAANESEARFSPDGRFLAYVSDETGQREVYVQSFPESGSKWQVSTAGGQATVVASGRARDRLPQR